MRNRTRDKWMYLLAHVLFVLIAMVGPVLVVCLRYGLFKEQPAEEASRSISPMVMIVLIVTVFRFKSYIIKWFESWQYSSFKHVVLGISKIMIFIILSATIHLATFGFRNFGDAGYRFLEDVTFVIDWTLVLSAIGYTLIMPVIKHYEYHISREKRKDELREVMEERETR